ncbi:MAG: GNAT family N-acetyltransferase [Planctomycetota bacterium]|nr:GNAT family N-acetyltransferase [Planctomycetota bacterium]
MAGNTPIPLTAMPIQLSSPVFVQGICCWSFDDAFVGRILKEDIPQRVRLGAARIWAYRDPSNEIVGFGTIDVCKDWKDITGGKPHAHIPLLAVNPSKRGHGHGHAIIDHLIGEAVLLTYPPSSNCCDLLFLEVYTFSTPAISLYEKHGFSKVRDEPFFDDVENQSYFLMARRVSFVK